MPTIAKTVQTASRAVKVLKIVGATFGVLSAIGIPLLVIVLGTLLFVILSQGGGYNSAATAAPAGCPALAGARPPTLAAPSSSTSAPAAATVPAAFPATDPRPGGTYAGVTLTSEQVTAAAAVAAAAHQLDLQPRALRIALAVAMQESTLNPQARNNMWVGLFQQSPDLYTAHDRTDPAGAADMFFRQLVARVPGYASDPRSDWEIGEIVQESGVGQNVQKWEPMAAALAQVLGSAAATSPPAAPAALNCNTSGGGANATFDPGNIISDTVFYNSGAMTVGQIRDFINQRGADCSGRWCLHNLQITFPAQPADEFCQAVDAGTDVDAADALARFSIACGINPQVMLVTLQKESQLLTRTDPTDNSYAAAWGWHCPDTGPGGAANCDPAYAGFFNQGYGMAKQWARYKAGIPAGKYGPYRPGATVDILWNVAESGCGGAPVTISNLATASLYTYTPYQPNAASLAAYPGEGDACSSYGNRNFFRMFQSYFGDTGGGKTVGPPVGGAGPVTIAGLAVTVPNSPDVPSEFWGKQVIAPTPEVANGIAAGLQAIGLPYVWGGGTDGGPADQGCSRAGGSLNSCQGTVGFDCSGLTGWVLHNAGFSIPSNSSSQRAGGVSVPRDQAKPGDIIGYPGHVAIYLGSVDGSGPYLLEAPDVGLNVRIRPVNWNNGADADVHRYWGSEAS